MTGGYSLPLQMWRERAARTNSVWAVGRCTVEVRELDQPAYMGPKPWPCIRMRVTFTSGRASGGLAAQAALAVAVAIFPGRAIGDLQAYEERIRNRHQPTEYYLGAFAYSMPDASVTAEMTRGYDHLPAVERLS